MANTKSSSLPAKIDMLEKVSELYLKSQKPTEIARNLGISRAQVDSYIRDYKALIQRQVATDPDFLERISDNTLESLHRFDQIIDETWKTYERAKEEELISMQTNLLKVSADLETKRANLLQLMGARMDGGSMARMQKAEKVNSIVSDILKEVVSGCPRCKTEVMPRLAEAFKMMDRGEDFVDMTPYDTPHADAEVVDAEVMR